ncbi:YhbY family RNA-binding protein [candidate division WOR-3 bacterium]|nr:YhbY family RNA-binding protein [candidate division WOR-3 bacterium]
MDNKYRKKLISAASKIKPVFRVGKSGITEIFISEIDKALSARELIKIEVNRNSLLDPDSAAEELAKKSRSEIVLVAGRKVVLFRKNEDKDE